MLLYETGHIPGAVKIDWHNDLNDPVMRDYVDGEPFATLMARKGIRRDTTVVFYGDKNNWWAAYALWVFKLFGHEDVRLLDGGRAKWTPRAASITHRRADARADRLPGGRARRRRRSAPSRTTCSAHLGKPLVDVRSPAGVHRRAHPHARLPAGGRAARRPHPRRAACRGRGPPNEDGTFKSPRGAGGDLPDEQGLHADDDVVAYCRIGERSSHTWFVLTYLLGFDDVRNYDGSWTEWGNAVRVPDRQGRGARRGARAMTARDCPTGARRDRRRLRRRRGARQLQLLLEFSRELPELPER